MASMALAFDILARDKGASRTFDKVGDAAKRAGDRGLSFGTMFKRGLGVAAGALAAAGLAKGITEVGQFLGDSIGEAREAQKVGRTTAQIIKSTGGAAKVSAAQVAELSERLSLKAGVDDELIQTGANLLLTFKNVRNEAGKGSAIFDRATSAAVDLSAAGFGSVEGASKMLGKALNDPLKGITALSRAGVTFTDQQKAQIKTLIESGDVLGAQKIILGEVESQVGGVAAASASMGEKVKVAFGNIKERIGTALLPTLDKLGAWFLEKGLPAFETFAVWFETKGIPALSRFGEWISDKMLPVLSDLGSWIRDKVLPALSDLGSWFVDEVLPKAREFGDWVRDKLWPVLKDGYERVFPKVRDAIQDVRDKLGGGNTDWAALGRILTDKVIPFMVKLAEVYLPAAAAQIGLVIDAVKAVGAIFELQITVVRKFTSFVVDAFVKVATTGADMLDVLSRVPGFGWAKDAADKLRTAAGKATALKDAINSIPPNKNVSVKVTYTSSGQVRLPNGTTVDQGVWKFRNLAGGGPVRRGAPYAVGDNPDGSWNKTTELFVAPQNGQIVNQRQIAAAMGSMGSAGESVDASVHIHGGTFGPSLAEIEREADRRRRRGALSPSGAGR